jgi:hypothetical protein
VKSTLITQGHMTTYVHVGGRKDGVKLSVVSATEAQTRIKTYKAFDREYLIRPNGAT